MKKKKNWKTAAGLLLLILVIGGAVWIAGKGKKAGRQEESLDLTTAVQETEPETKQETGCQEEEGGGPSEPEREEETEALTREEKTESRQQEPETEPVPTKPEPYTPPVLAVASDLHYQSRSITDFGKAYYDFVAGGDGKVVSYLPELLEAFIDEMIVLQPDAVVLSGDITMNGEAENHQELSQKLKRLQEAGIQVLVIPGNHDINNHHAARYFGSEKTPGQPVTAEEFYGFYHEFGYDQAESRDPASLSYIYPLDERYWLMMLDTCQYEPKNLVGGRIREETFDWMEEQFQKAEEAGAAVIPVGHHNLLPESSLYTTDCALEQYQEAADYFNSWKVPVYISGHLHVQRLKHYDGRQLPEEKLGPGPRLKAGEDREEAEGIYEIVSDAISIPPCQYGVLRWDEKGNMTYRTRQVDLSAWAAQNGLEDPNLLDFEEYSREYIKKLIARQIENKMEPVALCFLEEMTGLYADIYQDYYAGRIIDGKAVYSSLAWQWWMRLLPESRQVKEMRAMVGDSGQDNNYLYLSARAAEETDDN